MWSIYRKEVSTFFSSLTGYIVIAVFLLAMGLLMWVFPDFSILNYNFATLDQLFSIGPNIFIFLIPVITMRSFSEEFNLGTIELLETKPITDRALIGGKFFGVLTLIIFALLPTLLYYYTVYELGLPKGNIDAGATFGSYLGMISLAAVFASIGLFFSSITQNQIVAFILAVFGCFIMYYGFDMISRLPIFVGHFDDAIQRLGLDYHYQSISRGLLDTRDLLYFTTTIIIFLTMTWVSLDRRNW